MTLKIKSVLYSVVSGLFLVLFWVFINQMKGQSISDIVDLPNQTSGNTLYHDGNYQATSPTPWGDVSIDISVSNGRWNKIKYLQFPDSPPSQYAASYLAKQAMAAQNASIDGVSGATYISEAFRDDLTQIIQQSQT